MVKRSLKVCVCFYVCVRVWVFVCFCVCFGMCLCVCLFGCVFGRVCFGVCVSFHCKNQHAKGGNYILQLNKKLMNNILIY